MLERVGPPKSPAFWWWCASTACHGARGYAPGRVVGEPDFVIVGAGSAGCALAARLSEDPDVSVLLLEAGGKDRSPNIKIPAAFAKQFRTKLDWDYSTGPEPHLDGRELFVPRGRGLGGSSSMNAMMYTRGRPLDFDAWREAAATVGATRTSCPTSSGWRTTSAARSEFHGSRRAGQRRRRSATRAP